MKVRIAMGRSVREYATVIVEADSVEAAQAYVEQLLASDGDSEAYCDLVNAGSWESESDSVSDETVVNAEEYDDQDEEADVVVPGGRHARRRGTAVKPAKTVHLEACSDDGGGDGHTLCGAEAGEEESQLALIGDDADEPTVNDDDGNHVLCADCLAAWRREQEAWNDTRADYEQ